ncbi:MAG: FmdB family transcriptional regulator [Rhodothermales bacterium]|nr:FmdB family transcriptional regulator [Rhodothermales bacterium]MBO6781292.1 FmdB family transcriptional regulator [Rhodothermales bacterium]
MPTYTYRREDGSTFEIEQRITEDALTNCPTTGQPVKRLITGGAGLVFKGSGFYLTDYARKGSEGSKSGAEGKSEAKSSSGSDSKPASKDASAGSAKTD